MLWHPWPSPHSSMPTRLVMLGVLFVADGDAAAGADGLRSDAGGQKRPGRRTYLRPKTCSCFTKRSRELGGRSGGTAGRFDGIESLREETRYQQTLLSQFPPTLTGGLSPYFSMSVKIELGARSDHFPVDMPDVTPYLCDAFPDCAAISDKIARVRVLAAERTFWEKATILHMLHHAPRDKKIAAHACRGTITTFTGSRAQFGSGR